MWELHCLENDTPFRAAYVAFGEFPKSAENLAGRIEEAEPPYGDVQAFILSAITHNDRMQEVFTLCLSLRAKDAEISAELRDLHERGAAALQNQRRVLERLRQRLAQAQEALSGRKPTNDGANEDA